MRKWKDRIPGIFISLFWTVLVGAIFGNHLIGAIQQNRTMRWAEATGKIVIAEAGAGKKAVASVMYKYDVNGAEYTSKQIRLHPRVTGSEAREFVARNPAGAPVAVFYDPARPAEAVLIRGIDANQIFTLLFAVPFILIGVALWYVVAWTFRKPGTLGWIRLIEENHVSRVRPSLHCSVIWFGAALLLFVVILMALHRVIPLEMLPAACAIPPALAIVAGVFSAMRIASGSRDIVLDERAGTMRMQGGTGIPFSAIEKIEIAESFGGIIAGAEATRYRLIVHYAHEGQSKRRKLVSWIDDGASAERFAGWLHVKTGVAVDV